MDKIYRGYNWLSQTLILLGKHIPSIVAESQDIRVNVSQGLRETIQGISPFVRSTYVGRNLSCVAFQDDHVSFIQRELRCDICQ